MRDVTRQLLWSLIDHETDLQRRRVVADALNEEGRLYEEALLRTARFPVSVCNFVVWLEPSSYEGMDMRHVTRPSRKVALAWIGFARRLISDAWSIHGHRDYLKVYHELVQELAGLVTRIQVEARLRSARPHLPDWAAWLNLAASTIHSMRRLLPLGLDLSELL